MMMPSILRFGISSHLLAAALVALEFLAASRSWASADLTETTDCSDLAVSVVSTPMIRGRYQAISDFFECLTTRCPQSTSETSCDGLTDFFASLHPVARIDSAGDVRQLIELTHNAFTLIDSNSLYLTVGDADTYGAWYLQRVKRFRTDVCVVSLPFLMAEEYRRELVSDSLFRHVTGFQQLSDIPVPPSTIETDSARALIVRAWNKAERLVPIFLSPTCAVSEDSGLHVVNLGLVQKLSEPTVDSAIFLSLLTSMREKWHWVEASAGLPPEERAIRNTTIHYLSLAMWMSRGTAQGIDEQELAEIFELLDPVCRTNWRFNVLRFTMCQAQADTCESFLSRLRDYAKEHPEEDFLKRFLEDTEQQ